MSGERLQDHWVSGLEHLLLENRWNIYCLRIDGADHMTKMEVTPIYGKTL